MRQIEEKRKMKEKCKNIENERENIYIYILFNNTHFSLMCYVDRNILTSLSHD